MKYDITAICGIIISVALMVFTAYLVPYIKSRFDAAKLEKIMKWVEIGVQAAEMIFKGTGMGEKKKEYVMEFLKKKGFSVDTDSLDNMIESAVLKMKQALMEVSQ